MAIEELVAIIPPPEKPLYTEGDWRIAEDQFGVTFPSDFKLLIQRYGSGRFFNGLYIANPLEDRGRGMIEELLDTYRQICESCEYDLSLHPKRPGFLPWGQDGHGHGYCWWTEGAPDEWGTAQLGHNYEDKPERVPVPVTTFLARFVQNEYPTMLGGNLWTEEHRTFKPWK